MAFALGSSPARAPIAAVNLPNMLYELDRGGMLVVGLCFPVYDLSSRRNRAIAAGNAYASNLLTPL